MLTFEELTGAPDDFPVTWHEPDAWLEGAPLTTPNLHPNEKGLAAPAGTPAVSSAGGSRQAKSL